MSPGRRRVFELLSLSIAALFTGYLLVSVAQYVYMGWQYNEMSTGLLVVPMWIPQLSFLAGALLLFVSVIDELVTVFLGRIPSYVAAVAERHARGDFSEDV
jgi:TRAP-type C4-dicarboxylate transport system permease small subunit